MSSNVFSADLPLEPALQRIVVACAVLMSVFGQAMILLLPVGSLWQLLGCLACLVMTGTELYRLQRAWGSYSCARLTPDGSAWLLDSDDRWQAAELLPGSLLLRHYGWIRLQCHDGRRFAALYRGHCRHSADWRRLQVIWRHVGAAL